MRSLRFLTLGLFITLTLVGTACGGDTDTTDAGASGESTAGGVRIVTPDDAADIHADPPAGLVVLDVRTPEEFAEGHLEGATMIDFYREDFAEQIAQLDPAVPYLIYCRSGNRSGQTRQLMAEIGFTDVADIDGGATAWAADGHPLVS